MNDLLLQVIYADHHVSSILFRTVNEATASFKREGERVPILAVIHNYTFYPVVDQDKFGVYFK